MSGAGHTPGPWEADLDGGVIIAAGSQVASAWALDGRTPDERNANARLIAAAPELLEALEAGLDLADQNAQVPGWPGRTPEYQASYDRCRAAIAKARGQ